MEEKVHILGEVYSIVEDGSIINSDGADGLCERLTKTITIVPKDKILDEECSDEERTKRYNEVMRHEIIHAFFFESGLSRYATDEDLVDWIAVQFPKLLGTMQSVGCER